MNRTITTALTIATILAMTYTPALCQSRTRSAIGDFGKEKTYIDPIDRGLNGAVIKRPAKPTQFRTLTFPTEHSVGTIYSYKPSDEHMLGNSPRVGEAQGTIKVPVGMPIYMIPSDYAIAHPELLDKIAPDAFYGLSFGHKGAIMSVDKAVPHITRLTGLKHLHLKGCDLTDNQIAPISELRNLEDLILEGNVLNGSCLTNLSKLQKLIHLDMNFTPLKPPAFEILPRFPALEDLAVPRTGVDDTALAHISKIRRLKLLYISGSHITPKGLAQLKSSKTLRVLNLSECTLRNQDVLVLKGMPLYSLILPWKPGGNELAKIRKELSGITVEYIDRTPNQDQLKQFAPLH